MRLGEVIYLNEAEAQGAAKGNDESLERPWELWKREAAQSHGHPD
jgi:hypothetical protein